jgi:hypothetical protein
MVGITFREPAAEMAQHFENFDFSAGFAKTNPPSKTSISCGLP